MNHEDGLSRHPRHREALMAREGRNHGRGRTSPLARRLVAIARELTRELEPLTFGPPVSHVYNPLTYAREPHEEYLRRYARRGIEAVFLGVNPGPFGMAQTGVPFGEVHLARDWLGIRGRVGKPRREHPKRPVLGFACPRSEVSGARLWGWAHAVFGVPERFFERFFVLNYCPLAFMEASGRNITPEKLGAADRAVLLGICDRALRRAIEAIEPRWVVGVGGFAAARARVALAGLEVAVGRILHPSPQSPAANRGWARAAAADLRRLGIRTGG